MATQTPPRTAFQKWQEGIDKAENNPEWDAWDCEIQLAVNEYNRHLAGTAEYLPLDWQLIKAILWVESGPHKPDWNDRPMQIGMMGDPGAEALLGGKEGGDLVMPPALQKRLTLAKIRTSPADNIRAAVGYLLMRTARYENRIVIDDDDKIHEMEVAQGDNFSKIAKDYDTTVASLTELNPEVNPKRLRIGQTLKHQKSSIQRAIKGWRQMSTGLIADIYNGGGDSTYTQKLDYVLPLIQKREAVKCGQ